MNVTLLSAIAALAAAELSPAPPAFPQWLKESLAGAEAAMASVPSGRRLAAAALSAPLAPAHLDGAGPPVAFAGRPEPRVAVDVRRAKDLTAFELEMLVARERGRAAAWAGVELVEVDQAAEQAALEYALERAGVSEEFGGRLRAAAQRLKRIEQARIEDPSAPPAAPLKPAAREPDRTAELLLRFAREPDDFYWTVEHDLSLGREPVRLAELESFLFSNAERLDRAKCPPPGRYCRLDGRLLDPKIVEAARAALESGGLERVREALGAFQAEGADKLRARIRRWLEAP